MIIIKQFQEFGGYVIHINIILRRLTCLIS